MSALPWQNGGFLRSGLMQGQDVVKKSFIAKLMVLVTVLLVIGSVIPHSRSAASAHARRQRAISA
eukprot:12419802-Karenia_brevis.AAC.1